MIKKILHIAIISLLLAIGSCHTAWGWSTVNVAYTDLPSSGNWGTAGKTTNITGSGTINLTGNINILGPMAIQNGTITITNKDVNKDIQITWKGTCGTGDANEEKSMFRIRTGNTLKIIGHDGYRIYIDGGATWDRTNGLYLENEEAAAAGQYLTPDYFKPASGCKILYSGLIHSFGTLQLDYVNLRNTYTTDTSHAAAITVENNASSGTTKLNYVHFYRLVAALAPAIFLRGSATVADENTTKVTMTGGSIRCCRSQGAEGTSPIRTNAVTDSSLLLKSVSIFCNYSAGGGGAIQWNASGGKNKGTKLSLDGCKIYRNTSVGRGGGLFIESSFEFINNVTQIYENKAGGMGGGVYVNAYNGTSLTSAFDFVFNLNNKVSITNNTSSDVGGGASIDFDDGAIASGSTVTINIDGTTITGNKANHGGGVYIRYNAVNKLYTFTCKLGNSTISNNTANLDGGGIYMTGASINSTGSGTTTISGNKALDGRGGGIYLYNGNLAQANLTVTNNSSANKTSRENVSYYGGGIYQVNGNFTCSGAVTITGNSTWGRGGGFYVNSGTVTFSSTTAVADISGNTSTDRGGGFYVNDGNVNMQQASIRNNVTKSDGGGFAIGNDLSTGVVTFNGAVTIDSNTATESGQDGGGIWTSNGNLIFKGGATITNNQAANSGGGIFSTAGGSITFNNTATLTGNKALAGRGGGIYVSGGNITMSSTATISTNTAVTMGGGLYAANGDVTIANATLTSNSANAGGGIYTSGNGTLGNITITNATFDQNKALATHGGGIYLTSGNLNITKKAIFTNNTAHTTAGVGGGMYATGGEVIIADAELTKNSAYNGGGIYASIGSVTITNATFDQNTTTNHGGGLYVNQSNINIKTDATFSGNTATNLGGGIYATKADITIADAELTSNTAKNGGGIYTVGDGTLGNINITNATFGQNKATAGSGGGVYVNNANLDIKTLASFTSNTATVSGGGIYATTGAVTIKNANIESNTATTSGGGIYATGGDVTITTATLSSNQAADGGGMYVNNGNINITSKATITSNTATTAAGGGIYAASGGITIADADISGNNATTKGGGICLNGGTLTITKGDIKNNTAGTFGGGLHAESASAKTITLAGDGVFSSNTATTCGGGISVSGPITFNTSGTIESNSAKNGGGIYLTGGATMNFNEGMIRYNRATGTTGSAFTTAYQKTASQVYGVGGGVFVEESSRLLFNIGSTSFGLYGNSAEIAADDIFANGNSTTVQIPQVDAMVLNDFNVTTSRLLWAEDYVTGDTGYANGTKIINNWDALDDKFAHVIRYRAAQSILALRELVFTSSSLTLPRAIDAAYPPGPANYVCLTLGFNNMSVKITRTGLKMGESAIYTYTRSGDSEPMGRVVLTGMGESVPVSKLVVLSEGTWIIAENSWTYSYNVTAPSITRTISAASTDQERTFTFASAKESVPPHDEGNTVNSLK